jgi:hypothetical protein
MNARWLFPVFVVAMAALVIDARAEAPACGGRHQPPSPLQTIMRGIDKKNAASVQTAMASIGTAPAGYANWNKHVSAVLAAAKDGDIAAVEVACKGCHTEYRTRFQADTSRCAYRK